MINIENIKQLDRLKTAHEIQSEHLYEMEKEVLFLKARLSVLKSIIKDFTNKEMNNGKNYM